MRREGGKKTQGSRGSSLLWPSHSLALSCIWISTARLCLKQMWGRLRELGRRGTSGEVSRTWKRNAGQSPVARTRTRWPGSIMSRGLDRAWPGMRVAHSRRLPHGSSFCLPAFQGKQAGKRPVLVSVLLLSGLQCSASGANLAWDDKTQGSGASHKQTRFWLPT